MRAIRQHASGPPGVLRCEVVPDPEPGPGEVRIAVAVAGVHLVDATIRRGAGPPPRPALPRTPGREVAGTVDAVGPGVGTAWLGRSVVAHLGAAGGGYAERAVAAATALHEVPAGTPLPSAVAMIGTGRTALGVLDVAAVGEDDAVLVTAAAGGLGGLLVQGARRAGAAVVGLAGGAAKAARVRELGAAAVDSTAPDWPERVVAALGRRPTVALDGVGGVAGRAVLELLGPGGRLVLFGSASGAVTPFTGDDVAARGLTVSWALGPRLLDRLRPLERRALAALVAGELVPVVHPPFRLADAAAAHVAVEAGTTVGKVVLVP